MQTIEKALHQPMPFTTGGQTITDRLTAAKHSLAGSQLGKTICKATTEELMAPKKKHLDLSVLDLLHCTNEPNVSIPSMANLLIERTQNPNWTVVYKALITIHNIMCYGNERFSQYLASCNTTFNLGSFLDKGSTQGSPMDYTYSTSRRWASLDTVVVGYDMSQHVRRYGKYISEKIYTYRLCAYDFCKVKRGREDGLLRTMNTDKLLKTLPILQNQIDALLQFQVTSSELNNGVINCSFILLFRDLIRLFACYNDGVINLLEKYFDMNKKQCREALDMYKAFLLRLDKVAEFLKVAETVGIDRGEIPDLTRAPASLLEALEAHLVHLEGGKMPPSTNHSEQFAAVMSQSSSLFKSDNQSAVIEDSAKEKYLKEEKERLRMFEEQRKKHGAAMTNASEMNLVSDATNPFANAVAMNIENQQASQAQSHKPSDDLLSLFDPVVSSLANSTQQPSSTAQMMATTAATTAPLSTNAAHTTTSSLNLDPTNPFAQNIFQQQPIMTTSNVVNTPFTSTVPAATYPNVSTNAAPPTFGADFSRAFTKSASAIPAQQQPYGAESTNPFMMPSSTEGSVETTHEALLSQQQQQSWVPISDLQQQYQQPEHDWNNQTNTAADSSSSGDETSATALSTHTETVNQALRNPFGAMQHNAQGIRCFCFPQRSLGDTNSKKTVEMSSAIQKVIITALHTAGINATVATPLQSEAPTFCTTASNNSSGERSFIFCCLCPMLKLVDLAAPSPVPFGVSSQSAAQAVPQQQQGQQTLGIYDQTPFSHMDGSYTSSPVFPHHMQQQQQQGVDATGSLVEEASIDFDGKKWLNDDSISGNSSIDAYSQQQLQSSQQATKFGANDLDSALSSLADNLSIAGGKAAAASQGKPVQWNSQSSNAAVIRPPAAHQVTPAQMPFAQMPPQQWPHPLQAYQPQPGMYGQQAMMNVYAQQGFGQLPSAGVYGVGATSASAPLTLPSSSAPTTTTTSTANNTPQSALLQQSSSQHPFM
ncbi:unnamed protein product [Anisakis simplex]|uniref:ENTH domain-containing protein n=1 Tax=Anisakis simplex TaxID=6269 RepID=A0A0M3JSX2_ANISI|nr:unnamed protein product [Anisakis simplex]